MVPPGFFIVDTTVELQVNGAPVWSGSFMQGFDWWAPLAPGIYVLRASLQAPLGISRGKNYTVEVRPAAVTIVSLEYSRFWGNFEGGVPRITYAPT